MNKHKSKLYQEAKASLKPDIIIWASLFLLCALGFLIGYLTGGFFCVK